MTNNGKSTRLLQHYIGEPGKYVNSTSVVILLMVLMKLLIPLFINHDYGEASAINYYSSYFHIPQAISSNSSYWYGVIITIPAG